MKMFPEELSRVVQPYSVIKTEKFGKFSYLLELRF